MNRGIATLCRGLVLVVGFLMLATAMSASDPATEEVEELRRVLDQLTARVEALEAGGDPARAREIAEVRSLLEMVARRIDVLEGEQEAAAPYPVTEPAPAEAAPAGRFITDLYGSLRVRTLLAEGGEVELIDRFSRIGLFGAYPGGERWSVLGRFEVGMNLVNQNPVIDVGGDPGFSFGEGSAAFTTRLGFVGLSTPYGQVTWGKQWGVYYDVAGWTDEFYTFGGDAAGAYAQGDGGINGTGRAETAVQYRHRLGNFDLGLQVQNRNRTDNDRSYADTLGGSLRFDVNDRLSLGLAYNEVRDGVDDPGPNQPHLGDRGLVVGGRWSSGPLLLAVTVARGEQREQDDTGRYFDSRGAELFASWSFDQHWSVFGGGNWLEPDEDLASRYRILDFLLGAAYRLNPFVVISGEGRVAESRDAGGEPLRRDTFAFGVNIGW